MEEWIAFCVESKDASYLTDDGYIGKKRKGFTEVRGKMQNLTLR